MIFNERKLTKWKLPGDFVTKIFINRESKYLASCKQPTNEEESILVLNNPWSGDYSENKAPSLPSRFRPHVFFYQTTTCCSMYKTATSDAPILYPPAVCVSNIRNKKVPRKYRSSSNMNKIGQPKLGYLPLNFFNLSHYRAVATITRTNIIRSVSIFGKKKVPMKYRSFEYEPNRSTGTGLSALEFLHFFSIFVVLQR